MGRILREDLRSEYYDIKDSVKVPGILIVCVIYNKRKDKLKLLILVVILTSISLIV